MEQQITDLTSELQAGRIEKDLLDALKKIAFNTVNVQNPSGVGKTHTGELILTLKFSPGKKPDSIIVTSQLKSKVPTISGTGHATFMQDGDIDEFYVEPKTGFISINPIMQDDAEFQARGDFPITQAKTGK